VRGLGKNVNEQCRTTGWASRPGSGAHETAHFSEFSYGTSDRGAHPHPWAVQGQEGWLEDRRPTPTWTPTWSAPRGRDVCGAAAASRRCGPSRTMLQSKRRSLVAGLFDCLGYPPWRGTGRMTPNVAPCARCDKGPAMSTKRTMSFARRRAGIRFIQLWFTDVLGTRRPSTSPGRTRERADEGMTFDGSAIDGFSGAGG